MLASLGTTRASIQRNHALLTAESFERISQPGMDNADIIFLITPQMGARFVMALLEARGPGRLAPAGGDLARFAFVLEGEVRVDNDDGGTRLGAEGYVFLSPSSRSVVRYEAGTRLVYYEWRFAAASQGVPPQLTGIAGEVEGAPLRGDEALVVQKLLPVDAAFDAEFNLMSFEPGASLPYVETHFMEHGLMLLDGGGIYRLDDRWYPVRAGDVIWMGPHAPQWFGALGRVPSRYLIYKNYNRSPWAG